MSLLKLKTWLVKVLKDEQFPILLQIENCVTHMFFNYQKTYNASYLLLERLTKKIVSVLKNMGETQCSRLCWKKIKDPTRNSKN